MTILLIAEHDNTHLSDQTAKALTAAAQIGGDVHVLVAGKGAKAVADAAAGSDYDCDARDCARWENRNETVEAACEAAG